MENGLSSPRPDSFPAGLRVLVVDDDLTWLKILERMLKKCSYDVTTCNLARDALRLLRERKDGFDIVISDVNMPDMDGFKLLERVGLEMDLPVIMMSVDGETARVMKGVQHGACDYLLKPIRMKELRNIWQHVFRKKIHEVRDFESHDSIEDIHLMGNGLDPSDDGYFVKGADMNSVKKRRGVDHKHDDRDFGDPTFVKKARVVWSLDLHQKFVKAVNQIGFDKVGPKKILDLMNVPWLTRENVASHLQKYRLYLDRLQKENGQKTSSSGLNHSDFSSNDSAQSFGVQKSSTMLQNDVVTSSNVFVKNQNYKLYESKVSGITSGPLTDPKKAADGDLPNFHASSNSEMSIDHSFGLLEPDVNYIAVGSSSQNSSKGKVPKMQFKHKKQPPLKLEDGLSNVALRVQQNHLHLNHLQPAPSKSHEPSLSTATDEGRPSMIKKMYARTKNIFSSEVTSTGGTTQASEPISTSALNTRNSGFCESGINDLELLPKDLLSRSDSGFASLDESLPTCWLQGDCSTMNRGLENIEFLDYYDPGLFSEGQLHHDGSAVDIGYLYDTIEYPVVERGLFLA